MSKTKTAFFCSNCGQESAKWVGKCPACNEWNTYVEEVIARGTDKAIPEWKEFAAINGGLKTVSLEDISAGEEKDGVHLIVNWIECWEVELCRGAWC